MSVKNKISYGIWLVMAFPLVTIVWLVEKVYLKNITRREKEETEKLLK